MNNRRKTLKKGVYWAHHGKRKSRILNAIYWNKILYRKRTKVNQMYGSVAELMGGKQ